MSRRCWASAHSWASRLACSSAIVRCWDSRSCAVSNASAECSASSSISSTSDAVKSRAVLEYATMTPAGPAGPAGVGSGAASSAAMPRAVASRRVDP